MPTPLYLTRSDPSRNMARFYALSLEPTLFGEVSLVRNWGRIGTCGQVRTETFERPEAASAVFNHLRTLKLRKGYRVRSGG
ncbi:MAG: WGR domain-containing protein [Donghicola sp.]|nr:MULTISPECIES: WGR domain-containing protein [Donghicola]MCT4576392.1 WGR domain-containing protein [Donghicola sp.]